MNASPSQTNTEPLSQPGYLLCSVSSPSESGLRAIMEPTMLFNLFWSSDNTEMDNTN